MLSNEEIGKKIGDFNTNYLQGFPLNTHDLAKIVDQAKLANAQQSIISGLEAENIRFSRELSRQMEGWHKANEKIKALELIIERARMCLNVHHLILADDGRVYIMGDSRKADINTLESLLSDIRGLN